VYYLEGFPNVYRASAEYIKKA